MRRTGWRNVRFWRTNRTDRVPLHCQCPGEIGMFEVSCLLLYEVLGISNCFLREDAREYILSRLCLCVFQESKGRSIFSKTVIQGLLFVPAVICIIDLMVGVWVWEMQLLPTCEKSIRKNVQACGVLRSAQPLPRHLPCQQGLCGIIGCPTVKGMKYFQVMYKGSVCHNINVSLVKSRDCRNGRARKSWQRVEIQPTDSLENPPYRKGQPHGYDDTVDNHV